MYINDMAHAACFGGSMESCDPSLVTGTSAVHRAQMTMAAEELEDKFNDETAQGACLYTGQEARYLILHPAAQQSSQSREHAFKRNNVPRFDWLV